MASGTLWTASQNFPNDVPSSQKRSCAPSACGIFSMGQDDTSIESFTGYAMSGLRF